MKFGLLLFAAFWGASAIAADALETATCHLEQIWLHSNEGPLPISVELATNSADRATGLMGRTELADRHGMLFIYPEPQTAWFWMKDTPLSLDMIFIDTRGQIIDLVRDAKPEDETPVGGAPDTAMVLEISGGSAEALGLNPGDAVAHPMLDQSRALWPCQY